MKIHVQRSLMDPASDLNDSTRDVIKVIVKKMLEEDAQYRQTMDREIADFKEKIRRELGELATTVVGVSVRELLAAMGEIVAQKFAGQTLQTWEEVDSEGMVYGWQESVRVQTITRDGQCFMLYPQPNLDKAEVATIVRLKKFYESRSQQTVTKVKQECVSSFTFNSMDQAIAITGFVTEDVRTLATQQGVAIFRCRRQS